MVNAVFDKGATVMRVSSFPRTQRIFQALLVIVALQCAYAPRSMAQATGAVVLGTIVDDQGAVLPGATVSIRNVETGVTRSTASESDGGYRLGGLPPGRYDLSYELQGFGKVEVQGVTLTIGQQLRHDAKMGLQGVQETVTVTGEAPVIETTRTEVAAVITTQQIESLPIEGRQPVSLALLLPGTTTDATRPRRANANIGGGTVNQAQTAFHVDGGMNWSNNAGEPRVDVPTSAVREFKVNVSQASAEFGGNTGGVVNIITKSGTNQYRGEAFEYFRDKSLNAMNVLEREAHQRDGTPKPEYRRHQNGAALGGPIVRDRLHFFTSFEHTDVQQFYTVSTGQSRFYSSHEGSFPNTDTAKIGFVRGDLQLTQKQNLFARYIYMREMNLCETCGGNIATSGSTAVLTPRDTFVAGHTWVLGTRALNEIRVQSPWGAKFLFYTASSGTKDDVQFWTQRGVFPADRFSMDMPGYVFPSLTWGGGNSGINTTQMKEFRDDFSVTLGFKHNVKVGGAYLDIPSREDQPGNPLGTWTFGADQFFDGTPASIASLRNPIQFTAAFPPLTRFLENHWVQGYVQDDWRIRSNVTLNLGLRYDRQHNSFNQITMSKLIAQGAFPRPLPADTLGHAIDPKSRKDNNNFGPRIGLAWDINDDGRTVVRAAYGLYYQYFMQTPLRGEQTALRQTSINITNPPYPDPYGGRTPQSFASTAPPNVSVIDDRLQNPESYTGSVGLSREVAPNIAVHFDGVYTRMSKMAMTVRINTPAPGVVARPDPTWGVIQQTQSRGEHEYKAFFARLERRYANRYQYLFSYTLAKQENNGGVTAVTDFYDPDLDWGPGNADRRHAFVASGSVMLPYEISLGAVFNLRSTAPFNSTAGRDLNRDGTAASDYVPGTTRNMGNRQTARMLELVNAWRAQNGRPAIPASQIDTNEYRRLDLRANKTFGVGGQRKLELIAQLFNVLGRDNLGGVGSGWVTNALSDSFGRLLAAQDNRQAELAVRVIF